MARSPANLAAVRYAWQVSEPLHALTYFHPQALEAAADTGIKGFWMGYFGCRAAPLGAVGPEVVLATFYNFAPRKVHRAIPDAWSFAGVDKLLAARLAGVDLALWEIFGPDLRGEQLRKAARLAGRAAASAQSAGRPLAAANAGLPEPVEPHLALWQALTTLREHRGDGHVTTLVGYEVGPCEALVLAVATGRGTKDVFRFARGWTEDEWNAAVASLTARGWLDPSGAITAAGSNARNEIETVTDRLAAAPYDVLGSRGLSDLVEVLRPLADRVVAAGGFSEPNPIGLSWPPT